MKKQYTIEDLLDILVTLRGENGCPWDRVQTHESIKKDMIEEAYEAIDALQKGDDKAFANELGDVLLQVVFHAQMEQEAGRFSMDDVADGVCKKLIERHPHIFGEVSVNGVDDVLTNWDAIKKKTKGQKTTSDSMNSVPRELPALMRATKLQKKAADVGFDWDDVDGALDKLEEEIAELRSAIAKKDKANMDEELGDILFSAVNVSRFIKADAEESLTAASDKFLARFTLVEQLAAEKGIDMKSSPLEVLDSLWDEAKVKNSK